MNLVRIVGLLALLACGNAQAEIVVAQIAPFSGPLASAGKGLRAGANCISTRKTRPAASTATRSACTAAQEAISGYDVGGIAIGFAADDHVGSRYSDITILNRRLLR